MLPSFFIAHGAPLLAIENNEYTRFLESLGTKLPKPKAIVLFSAHWESDVQKISNVSEFDTIYDFGGFPEELYQIKYPAKGDSKVSTEIEDLLATEGIPCETNTSRGLDHGAWVVLRRIYSKADIPVISMSVNPSLSPAEQYKIGKSLAHLREKNILIIASGGTVHNLRAVRMDGRTEVDQWALDFDQWLEEKLSSWDLESLFNYETLAPAAQHAVPPFGKEHFIPIYYAMGAADQEKTSILLHRSYRYGNLSHSVWQFGELK
ncbi:class III extradiol ring-cleavage dioxygenase [Bacillus sp. 31A1R]|uniref:Class III extradiol ring-cleavage dioxygenase n=1 Tax=Robertmurraya mangrovi TaxID=3098077 RepID=A0ABU5J2N2_9BACI|nr:class III extradiol ring-cleavage dioxygenase [Bacillus sp. 31A1R]MDZ5473673.1 class III extradiol ring-cleavage dioxygenase [Bacillus sp. 31A1R]